MVGSRASLWILIETLAGGISLSVPTVVTVVTMAIEREYLSAAGFMLFSTSAAFALLSLSLVQLLHYRLDIMVQQLYCSPAKEVVL